MKFFILLLSFNFFSLPSAFAARVRLEFSSQDQIDESTLVLNSHFGALHPTLQVIRFDDGTQIRDLSVGSGDLGAFIPQTYSQFDEDGDSGNQIIVVNTDRYPILRFTEFTLSPGWVLHAIGTQPLQIESLGPVLIQGQIDCRGQSGQPGVAGVGGAGGEGRCGGGPGGRGGNIASSASPGESPRNEISGGLGGVFAGGPAVGGGGGGSWNRTSLPGNGINASAGSGQAGVSLTDPDFSFVAGSAGGGGGSGSLTSAGGGGGAGGGAVIIRAVGDVTIDTGGLILVNGGAGGDGEANGGPGAGGGGGSVQIFTGGNLNILNPDGAGAVRAEPGVGGTNTSLDAGANGGSGRNWLTGVVYNGIGFYTPAEEGLFQPGEVTYSDQLQFLTTQSFDLLSTRWRFASIGTRPENTEYRVSASGSDTDDPGSFSAWTEDLSSLQSMRYLRLRISLQNTKGNQADFLEELTLNYDPQNQDRFDFISGGCGQIQIPSDRGRGGSGVWMLLLPFCLSLALSLKLESLRTSKLKRDRGRGGL
jgi:hypothetical protein